MPSLAHLRISFALSILLIFAALATAAPPSASSGNLERTVLYERDDSSSNGTSPNFPDSPPSCPPCAANYGSIQHCAQAAPVLANFSMVRAYFSDTRVSGTGAESDRADRFAHTCRSSSTLARSWTSLSVPVQTPSRAVSTVCNIMCTIGS